MYTHADKRKRNETRRKTRQDWPCLRTDTPGFACFDDQNLNTIEKVRLSKTINRKIDLSSRGKGKEGVREEKQSTGEENALVMQRQSSIGKHQAENFYRTLLRVRKVRGNWWRRKNSERERGEKEEKGQQNVIVNVHHRTPSKISSIIIVRLVAWQPLILRHFHVLLLLHRCEISLEVQA